MHLHRPTRRDQSGFSVIEVLLVVLVISALAVTGFVVYQHHKNSTYSTAATNTSHTTTQKQKSTVTPAQHPDPYAGWKSYTSSFEKLSFRYPSNWSTTPATDNFGVTGADSFLMTSPSGSMTVSWFSAVQGIGGACDSTIMPGTTVSSGNLSPCPYWSVLDKQKLAGADLYYVAGVETDNGTTYSPWCGLQSSDGITKNEGNIGYMLFMGKNNDFIVNGHNNGPIQAGMMCSKIPGNLGGKISMTGTKAQATAFLSNPEFQQAKLILMSASY